ncbi:MAG TPA: hypothetical protein VJX67_11400, partial [Blastocatellia bacterium]|nr:hypothetical protein [Blastocatellia bacterium]
VPVPAQPPVDATLTSVDYDLRIDGDLASGEVRLTVDVIKDGWVRVAIPAGLMIREAHLDGKQVSLIAPPPGKEPPGKGQEASHLLLSHTGRSVLTLVVAIPVSSVAGTDILQLPVGAAAVSRASVALPHAGVDVHVAGGLLLDQSEAAGESRWVAYGHGNQALTFSWKRKVDDQRAAQPLKLRGTLTELVGLGEDSTQVNAEVQIEVLQGEAAEVHIQLPEHFAVNQVSGGLVADWESTARELIVTFIQPVQQTASFTLSGEIRLPRDGQIDVPLIRLAAAERESGGVGVEVLGAGEIKQDRKAIGMEEAEAGELGQLISSRQSPSLIAYRLRPAEGQSPRSLALNVARYTPQAVLTANIEEAYYSALITDDGKMLILARLAVRNNQRNFLKLKLPASAVLWSASVGGRPIRPGSAPDGSLLLPLEKNGGAEDAPAFAVEVAYLDRIEAWAGKTEKGRARISLLTLDLPISKSELLVYYSPLFRLTPVPGNLRVATYQRPESPALSSSPGAGGGNSSVTSQAEDGQNASAQNAIAQSEAGQALVSHLHPAMKSTPARNLPIRVSFPYFGPSIFFVSELTSENQTPAVELDYQRDKKRGER